jgi:hypothetical protein
MQAETTAGGGARSAVLSLRGDVPSGSLVEEITSPRHESLRDVLLGDLEALGIILVSLTLCASGACLIAGLVALALTLLR